MTGDSVRCAAVEDGQRCDELVEPPHRWCDRHFRGSRKHRQPHTQGSKGRGRPARPWGGTPGRGSATGPARAARSGSVVPPMGFSASGGGRDGETA